MSRFTWPWLGMVESLHEGFIGGSIGGSIGGIGRSACTGGGISSIGHLIIKDGDIIIIKVLIVG